MASRSGSTALITGASAGLGLELAHLFAADGHGLVLVARRRDRLEALAAELGERYGIEATPIPVDLARSEGPGELYDTVRRAGIDVDFLVNNAGFGTNGPFVELDLQRELDLVQVNIAALVHLTRLFLPAMVERSRGRVLNIGSTAGFQPGPFMASYYASKAFVNHFSEALAVELKGTGVTVTVHCPGATATEFGAIAGNDRSKLFKGKVVADAKEVAREAYESMHAGKRMVVHGLKNRFLIQVQRVGTRGMALGVTAKLNRP